MCNLAWKTLRWHLGQDKNFCRKSTFTSVRVAHCAPSRRHCSREPRLIAPSLIYCAGNKNNNDWFAPLHFTYASNVILAIDAADAAAETTRRHSSAIITGWHSNSPVITVTQEDTSMGEWHEIINRKRRRLLLGQPIQTSFLQQNNEFKMLFSTKRARQTPETVVVLSTLIHPHTCILYVISYKK